MLTHLVELTPQHQEALRALRLYHWRQAIKLSRWAKTNENASPRFNGPKREHLAKTFRDHSNFHMKQVQLLNDFFKVGDTAEKDNEQARIQTVPGSAA